MSVCEKCGVELGRDDATSYRGATLCRSCAHEATGVVNKAFDDWLKSPEKTEREWLDNFMMKLREYGKKQNPDCPDCGERLRSFGVTQFYCWRCGQFYKKKATQNEMENLPRNRRANMVHDRR